MATFAVIDSLYTKGVLYYGRTRETVQEAYIEKCDKLGIMTGELTIVRLADSVSQREKSNQ